MSTASAPTDSTTDPSAPEPKSAGNEDPVSQTQEQSPASPATSSLMTPSLDVLVYTAMSPTANRQHSDEFTKLYSEISLVKRLAEKAGRDCLSIKGLNNDLRAWLLARLQVELHAVIANLPSSAEDIDRIYGTSQSLCLAFEETLREKLVARWTALTAIPVQQQSALVGNKRVKADPPGAEDGAL